jgi:S-disulfanyl-L-cysteine oxidoreductase SoxD
MLLPRRLALLLALGACTDPAAPDDPRADPGERTKVSRGERIYVAQCAACHGAKLEGQADWRRRLPNGRMPAPPHDETGHTWHHADRALFAIVKDGLVPPYAPPNYQSDMPAFRGKLSDEEIWAVLAYIKSRWPAQIQPIRAEMTRNATEAKR